MSDNPRQYHSGQAVSSSAVFQPDLFKGKVIFVTGGATGICFKITESVMRHGAAAFIFGRREAVLKASSEALTRATGNRCGYAAGDVRKPENLKTAATRCVEELGRIDFVVCGAAGNFLSSIDRASENAFKTVIDIDLLGTYNTIKATLPHVKASRGSYVSISATLHYAALPFQAHASAAKAGVDALTNVVAAEMGPFGVRANIIAPGPIADTEGVARLSMGGTENLTRKIPAQRFGQTDDIANTAVFLFSPAASFITGATLVCDGGSHHMGSTLTVKDVYPDALLQNLDLRELSKAGVGEGSKL